MNLWLPLCLTSLLTLAACTSTDGIDDVFTDKVGELNKHGPAASSPSLANTRQIGGASNQAGAFRGVTQQGDGLFVSSPMTQVRPEARDDGTEGYSLNLVNAPVAAAAKSVLGDALKANYVVDPRVTGTVTLQTEKPVGKDALADVFESALAVDGAVIVKRGDTYQIVPASDAFSSTPRISLPSNIPSGPGIKVVAVQLRYISADEMKSILEPITRQGSVLRADANRNLLVLAGNGADMDAMREAISVFDVDWMKGMSVALAPLKASHPDAVAKELETIFASNDGPGSKLIRFVPNDRLNAILMITSRPAYLTRAKAWIDKLDRLASTNEQQMFVYQIQNRPAKDLAQVLQDVLKSQETGGSPADKSNPVAPNLQPTAETAAATGDSQQPQGTTTDNTAAAAQPASYSAEPDNVKTSVVADVENNALLISTTAREYEHIQDILKQLDVVPTQVMIEAVIAEVTLNDELKFGLRWFFENGKFGIGFSDLATGGTGASFPGFAWSYATNDINVTLNALSSITNVNVVSAPTLMALNNQKATLQVGDQVPIVTQQTTSVSTSDAPVVNSVEMKDTGVILSVTPHVNSSGRVMLDIQQEVSSVVKTTSSGIDSPTIQQRKISTRVLVDDNSSLALGGLIQQKNSLNRSQVPILGDMPILGNAFKQKDDTINKTELIIFIRPRIVRDANQARDVTDEFRKQLNFGSAIQQRRGGANDLQQTAKRLAY